MFTFWFGSWLIRSPLMTRVDRDASFGALSAETRITDHCRRRPLGREIQRRFRCSNRWMDLEGGMTAAGSDSALTVAISGSNAARTAVALGSATSAHLGSDSLQCHHRQLRRRCGCVCSKWWTRQRRPPVHTFQGSLVTGWWCDSDARHCRKWPLRTSKDWRSIWNPRRHSARQWQVANGSSYECTPFAR